MTAEVTIAEVTHRFGDVTALETVSLTIAAGRLAVLLGPSGCGKTTLLSILGGFLQPSAGRVMIGGTDVTDLPPAKRPTTTMFQDYALFPHMTLQDNVGFGLRMGGLGRRARHAKAEALLALVGLPDTAGKKPHELSGGQRQRVALARALAVEPDVLLLDEPLGALDLKLRRQMQDELKAIQRRVGTTFVHVTHDQEEAMAIADDIIVMNAGRVQDMGAPDAIYLRPKNRFTAAFMGEANFIDGVIAGQSDQGLQIETPLGTHSFPTPTNGSESLKAGDAVEICFRPEHLRPNSEARGLIDLGAATISDIAFFGTHHRCHLRLDPLGARTLAVHLPQTMGLHSGDTVRLRLDPADVIVLPAGKVS